MRRNLLSSMLEQKREGRRTRTKAVQENIRLMETMEKQHELLQKKHHADKQRLLEQSQHEMDALAEQQKELQKTYHEDKQRLLEQSQQEMDALAEKQKELQKSFNEDKQRLLEQSQQEKQRLLEQSQQEMDALAEQQKELQKSFHEDKQRLLEKSQQELDARKKDVEEHMRKLEVMEERHAEMQRRHDEDTKRLREQSQQELEEELKATTSLMEERMEVELAERLAVEKASMAREMDSFKMQSETAVAKERADYQRRVEELRVEYQRKYEEGMALMKAEMAGESNDSYAQFEQQMAEERADMSRTIAAYRAQCERQLAEERATTTQKLAAYREQVEQRFKNDAQKLAAYRETIETFREHYNQISREKEDMSMTLSKLQEETESYMARQEMKMLQRISEAKVECERITKEKEELIREMTKVREEAECKMAQEKADLQNSMAEFREECDLKVAQEKEDTARKVAEVRAECERIEAEKAALARKMGRFSFDMQRKMMEEQSNMERTLTDARSHCERTIAEEKDQMAREMADMKRDFEIKMAEDKARLNRQMSEALGQCERLSDQKANIEKELKKMEQDKRLMLAKMAETRSEYTRMLKDEKADAERALENARRQTEAQLQSEREITENIMNTIRELPPLQSAMELGDLSKLESELAKYESKELPERFGDCKGVVEAVVKLARERLLIWREVDLTMKDIMLQMERMPGTPSIAALTDHCQRLFRALKEAQLTKMDVRRSDPKATEHICQVLLAWQSRAMAHSNSVQKSMVMKVATAPNLGSFDFADLDICLRLVDRLEEANEMFLSRALVLVQDPETALKDLRPLLAHLETMLFFLKYTKFENLGLTHAEFKKQEANLDPIMAEYFSWAEQEYPPGCELVHLDAKKDVMDRKAVSALLSEVRKIPKHAKGAGLGHFREIFYQWALAMRSKFDLLVLPHHTQVVCLMIFRRFLEDAKARFTRHRALIAQVGTGEGKSMIVATLAIYVAMVLRKKVHVVIDDETLLERDFESFKQVFDAFSVQDQGKKARQLTYMLCVSEDHLRAAGTHENARFMASRVNAEVDIAYCEAKHVQSFYASIARGDADFSTYEDRVLILDEVDALVIDEEPNEPFVYPSQDLSKLATEIAHALHCGASLDDLSRLELGHSAARRVVREMASEWQKAKALNNGEDFVYASEAGKYHGLQSGRANAKSWSLALECRNFQDGLTREILFQERLFVMSRPRVFCKYHRILGLSGSIGSEAERSFIKDTYAAAFFEVPPFLKTCSGSPFHEAVPVPLGPGKRAVYLESTPEAHLNRVAEVALDARERVPVLVIARDRGHCEALVQKLRFAAQQRGLNGKGEDMIRSLARTLYEADPQRWKENLNRSTLPMVDEGGRQKKWRVTVTDPRGGRGTDYRVDDQEVDERGGLLLIPTFVPTSQRTWKQFLGRTARQDRRGQFCTVLCASDYEELAAKYRQRLPTDGSMSAVDSILSWGDREVAGRIRSAAALYNTGVRINELCEEVFSNRRGLLQSYESRECIVEVCQRFRGMSVQDVNSAFRKIMDPADVPSHAVDLGAPARSASAHAIGLAGSMTARQMSKALRVPSKEKICFSDLIGSAPKVVMFCLDWSASMMSQDTGIMGMTRFGLCVDRIRNILREHLRDRDLVGVVGFGSKVETVFAPHPKAESATRLDAMLSSLRADTAGGTCFFDAVSLCLDLLAQQPQVSPRWLICLTDGDDAGSRKQNSCGQLVTSTLHAGVVNLNMMMITVGKLQETNMKVIDSWVQRVVTTGGVGRHISAKDAGAIGKSFEEVADVLDGDVGGNIEC